MPWATLVSGGTERPRQRRQLLSGGVAVHHHPRHVRDRHDLQHRPDAEPGRQLQDRVLSSTRATPAFRTSGLTCSRWAADSSRRWAWPVVARAIRGSATPARARASYVSLERRDLHSPLRLLDQPADAEPAHLHRRCPAGRNARHAGPGRQLLRHADQRRQAAVRDLHRQFHQQPDRVVVGTSATAAPLRCRTRAIPTSTRARTPWPSPRPTRAAITPIPRPTTSPSPAASRPSWRPARWPTARARSVRRLPCGIQTNDILLLFLDTSNQTISISNQNGGTWTQVTNSPQGTGTGGSSGSVALTVFWSRYNGTQGAPTTSDSGDHQIGRIIAIRGATTSGNPWDVTAGGVDATASTTATIPGATTTVANTLVVVAVAYRVAELQRHGQLLGLDQLQPEQHHRTHRQHPCGRCRRRAGHRGRREGDRRGVRQYDCDAGGVRQEGDDEHRHEAVTSESRAGSPGPRRFGYERETGPEE